MILTTLNGSCGSGKSTLTDLLKKHYYHVRTNYKDCDGVNLSPNSYESKIDYTLKWFEEIKIHKNIGTKILISDRSPFDCIAYLKENQERYQSEVNRKFEELEKSGICIKKVFITARKNKLKERINNRGREKLILEAEISDLDLSLEFFSSEIGQCDFLIDSSNTTPLKMRDQIISYIDQRITYPPDQVY